MKCITKLGGDQLVDLRHGGREHIQQSLKWLGVYKELAQERIR